MQLQLPNIVLPQNLEQYLRQSEKPYADINKGAEKTLIWADAQLQTATEISLVYLHGYSATRQEISPVCETVAKQLNANLFLTRLTGHGRNGDAMREISVEALLKDTMEALAIGQRIGRKVWLIGNSTGATLATIIASYADPATIQGMILLSPNFGLRRFSSELLAFPGARFFLRLIQGSVYRFTPANEKQARFWTTEYPSIALIPLMKVIKIARKAPLQNITQAVLCLYSEQDRLLRTNAMRKYFDRIASQQKIMKTVDGVGSSEKHVLAGDILSPQTTQAVTSQIVKFIQQNQA